MPVNIFNTDKVVSRGSLKFHLGKIHLTFLYKLFVQLQRFIVNIEAIAFMQTCLKYIKLAATKTINLLRSSIQIHTQININGPIVIFPQKSSSPNLIIIDTGRMVVENFFKEQEDETTENILVKIEHVTTSRGIMTLTSSLQMQEIIIEPFGMNLDAKKFIYNKPVNNPLIWDLNGALQSIHITLGQRDVCIICSIFKENMEEGNIVDMFPESIEPQQQKQADDIEKSVRVLENFFCQSRQKWFISRFTLDCVYLALYFDSGEVLSSPIRDVNHGLCKFELADVCMALSINMDNSLDGKLSINSVLIQEIGPNANVLEREYVTVFYCLIFYL